MEWFFFGNKSKHIEDLETKQKHVHEASPIMWIPFAILSVGTIIIGTMGFLFESEIHHILSSYLAHSFNIVSEEHNGSVSSESSFAINPVAVTSSVIAFGIGAGLGILFYVIRKSDPEIISRNTVLKQIWTFLYNRWYLNALIYWAFAKIPLWVYDKIWRYFERIIIQGINPAFQYLMIGSSKLVKLTQTGVTQTYLFAFAAGLFVLLIMLFL